MLLLLICGAPASGCSGEAPPAPAPPLVDVQQARRQAVKHQDHRVAMRLAEDLKCRELRRRLKKAGARPHLLEHLRPTPIPRLPWNAGIFALYQHQNQILRYVVTHHGVQALPPLALAELEPLIIATRDELEHGALEPLRLNQLLRSLYILLISPAQEPLRDTRDLLIIPHGLTRFVPFHALNIGTAQAPHYWVQELNISYTPCLALAVAPSSPIYRAEIIAPLYGRKRQAQPGAVQEVSSIARVFNFDSRQATFGATPERFESALLRPLSLVHFSGHGLAEMTPESPTELLFPRGSRSVTLKTATHHRAQAEVVVLGSCTTAYAARFRGERPGIAEVNLPEALLAAGVRTVVAASWTVKDLQSARMMKIFYDARPAEGIARALNRAYRQAISQLRPPHPRFWAFYGAYGSWRPPGSR